MPLATERRPAFEKQACAFEIRSPEVGREAEAEDDPARGTVAGAHRGAPALEEVASRLARDGLVGGALVAEVQVEGTGGNVGRACHLGGGRAVVAASAEDFESGIEQPGLGLPLAP